MATYYGYGDAIKGERIVARTRKIGKSKLIQYSGQHKGTELKLEKEAFCVIDREIQPVRNK